jgi:hypothetical protein
MQFRCAALIGGLDVIGAGLSKASSEPCREWSSKARDEAGSRLELAASAGMFHRSIEAEIDVIPPHAA